VAPARSDDGTYARLFDVVRAEASERDERFVKLLSIDSTHARARQHAAVPCLSGSGETERSPNRVSLTGREWIEIDDFDHG